MKFNCPHCGAPFDSKGLPVKNVTCPSCKKHFIAKPPSEPKRIDNNKQNGVHKRDREGRGNSRQSFSFQPGCPAHSCPLLSKLILITDNYRRQHHANT